MKIYEVINKPQLLEQKNLHLEHLEDEIINQGYDGAVKAFQVLGGLRNMLAGHSGSHTKVTVKWDGAPAIIAGKDPETGKFFVGTKSVFGKRKPKINFTAADVDNNHEDDLADKLKLALKYLPSLGIDGVLQGDMMFTPTILKQKKIEGIPSLIFKPNTIVYVVPMDSELAKEMMAAKIGIVWHTAYEGPTIADMKATFDMNISNLNKTGDVWFRDASYEDVSGSANMTAEETQKITGMLEAAEKYLTTIDKKSFEMLSKNTEFTSIFKIYSNHMIRQGKPVGDVKGYLNGFVDFYKDRKQAEVDKMKTERGQTKKKAVMDEGLEFFKTHMDELGKIVSLYKMLINAKLFMVRKLEKIESIGTFVEVTGGYKVTAPEGFVAIDHVSGGGIKLVDRLEFSHANFTAGRDWKK